MAMTRRYDLAQLGTYDRYKLANPWDDNPEPEPREEPFYRCECGAPLWRAKWKQCRTCAADAKGAKP